MKACTSHTGTRVSTPLDTHANTKGCQQTIKQVTKVTKQASRRAVEQKGEFAGRPTIKLAFKQAYTMQVSIQALGYARKHSLKLTN